MRISAACLTMKVCSSPSPFHCEPKCTVKGKFWHVFLHIFNKLVVMLPAAEMKESQQWISQKLICIILREREWAALLVDEARQWYIFYLYRQWINPEKIRGALVFIRKSLLYFGVLKTYISLAKWVNKDLAQIWNIMSTFKEHSNMWATYSIYF